MSFFDSTIVQDEIRNIGKLAEMISDNVLLFPSLSDSEKSKRVDSLQDLLNKMRLFYARLTLSDDPEAKTVKEQMNMAAQLMQEENLLAAFDKIQYLIDNMKNELSKR